MLTKWKLIAKLGMVEARRRGLADKQDQLLYASKALCQELLENNGIAHEGEGPHPYSPDTTLGYLRLTLTEFREDQ